MAMQLRHLHWMSGVPAQRGEGGASEEQFGIKTNLGCTEMSSPPDLQAGSPAAS